VNVQTVALCLQRHGAIRWRIVGGKEMKWDTRASTCHDGRYRTPQILNNHYSNKLVSHERRGKGKKIACEKGKVYGYQRRVSEKNPVRDKFRPHLGGAKPDESNL
jgi:hypothetical protein